MILDIRIVNYYISSDSKPLTFVLKYSFSFVNIIFSRPKWDDKNEIMRISKHMQKCTLLFIRNSSLSRLTTYTTIQFILYFNTFSLKRCEISSSRLSFIPPHELFSIVTCDFPKIGNKCSFILFLYLNHCINLIWGWGSCIWEFPNIGNM